MDLKQIRNKSLEAARALGVEVLATLPLLEAGLQMRSVRETSSRILAMNAVAATAYGFDRAKAIAWLNQEGLTGSLTEQEKLFVFEGAGRPERFRAQVEGMWALAWAMGIAGELDFGKDCDNRFATMVPNIKQSESGADFSNKARPLPLD